MIEFIRNAFRQCFTAVLVIIVIGFTIIGTIIGTREGESGAVIGFLVGAVIGFVIDILFGGMTATFLSIDEKLQNVDKNLQLLVAQEKGQRKKEAGQSVEGGKSYFIDSRDGRKYRTVEIGGRTWMAQNLNHQPQTGNSWCYNGENSIGDIYGRLYDWDTAKSVSPVGWHLPIREEWEGLVAALGDYKVADTLKAGFGWKVLGDGRGNGTDAYGFSALPAGYRDPADTFNGVKSCGIWWTATEVLGSDKEAYSMGMDYDSDDVTKDTYNKEYCFSVRCVKDKDD